MLDPNGVESEQCWIRMALDLMELDVGRMHVGTLCTAYRRYVWCGECCIAVGPGYEGTLQEPLSTLLTGTQMLFLGGQCHSRHLVLTHCGLIMAPLPGHSQVTCFRQVELNQCPMLHESRVESSRSCLFYCMLSAQHCT